MGRPIERFKPGDPITAARWNELVDAIEDLANVQFGDGFEVQQGPNGRVVSLDGENEIMARLKATATAGVYSWSEVFDDPVASWPTIPGGRSGVGDAYEVNRAPKCDGYVVRLTPAGTWYAFYVPMLGGGCPGGLCLDLTCCGHINASVLVVASQGGATIASGTTSGPVLDVVITNGGSYASRPTVTFSGGGGSGAAGVCVMIPFGLAGQSRVGSIFITNGGAGYTSQPAVAFSGGGGAGAAGSVNIASRACLPIPGTGDYQVSCADLCGLPTPATVTAKCDSSAVPVSFSGGLLSVTVTGCNGATTGNPSDMYYTVTGPNGYGAVGGPPLLPQDFLGTRTYCVPIDGVYTVTVFPGACYLDPGPQSVTVTACSGAITIPLTPVDKTTTLTVAGCGGLPLPGAAVSVTGDGFAFAGTTDASGQVVFTLKATCKYTLTISKSRFVTYVSAIDVVCDNDSQTPSVSLAPVDGYVCVPCCADPILPTLTVTSAAGNCSVTRGANPGQPDWWAGCQSAPPQTVSCMDGLPFPNSTCTNGNTYTGSPAVGWRLMCLGNGQWELIQTNNYCTDGTGGIHAVAGSCSGVEPISSAGAAAPCPGGAGGNLITGFNSLLPAGPCGGPLHLSFTFAGALVVNGPATVTE